MVNAPIRCSMRRTITIPDSFLDTVQASLDKRGYTSLNDYLLDLIRQDMHQFGATPQPITHQLGAVPQVTVVQSHQLGAEVATKGDSFKIPPPKPHQSGAKAKEPVKQMHQSGASTSDLIQAMIQAERNIKPATILQASYPKPSKKGAKPKKKEVVQIIGLNEDAKFKSGLAKKRGEINVEDYV